MKDKTLTLKPLGGLCNRLFAIDSAINVCMEVGFDLDVIWVKDKWLNASFYDLFQNIPSIDTEVSFKEYDLRPPIIFSDRTLDLPRQKAFNTLLKVYQRTRYDLVFHGYETKKKIQSGHNFLQINKYKRPYISAWMKLIETTLNVNRFRPQSEIEEIINRQSAEFNENTIGVHIRRGDHKMAIAKSPLSLFESKMSMLSESNPKTKFFVASDSEEVKIRMKDIFQEKVIFKDIEPGVRTTRSGMISAVEDLYLLSKTSRILGNSESTFALAAGELGNIPFEEVSIK